MEIKICCRCGEEKKLSEFGRLKSSKDGFMYYCKQCNSLKGSDYRKKNKKTYQNYLENNREKRIQYMKDYNKINKDKISQLRKEKYNKNKENILLKNKEYHKNNKEKIRIRKKNYVKNRRMNDTLFYLKSVCRKRIYNFLKSKGLKKTNKTFDSIGCNLDFLKSHIESQFTEGMSWDLMGKYIHIDHIIPLSSAKTEEEIYKLCHYTNLQPLWSIENIRKGDKIL